MKLFTLLSVSLSFTSLALASRSHSIRHRNLHKELAKKDLPECTTPNYPPPTYTSGDPDDHESPGILLVNKSPDTTSYYFYNNFWNGEGTAGANFVCPEKYITMTPGEIAFVSLPLSFKGRVQRGTDSIHTTWAEFQLRADSSADPLYNDYLAHGDISLQQGCDGAATISSSKPYKGKMLINGFTDDVLTGAPDAAIRNKSDGTRALASTEGNWEAPKNRAAIDWLQSKALQGKVYIEGGTGVADVGSGDNRLWVVFY